MLYGLVRLVKRRASSHSQFTQRIPAGVLPRPAGLKLSIPLGSGEFHHLTISPAMKAIRLRSTATLDPRRERGAPVWNWAPTTVFVFQILGEFDGDEARGCRLGDVAVVRDGR
jgi:hypothetical protein